MEPQEEEAVQRRNNHDDNNVITYERIEIKTLLNESEKSFLVICSSLLLLLPFSFNLFLIDLLLGISKNILLFRFKNNKRVTFLLQIN